MKQVMFKPIPNGMGRGWVSECGRWEVAMLGLGRFALYLTEGGERHPAGTWPTRRHAEKAAEAIQGMVDTQKEESTIKPE